MIGGIEFPRYKCHKVVEAAKIVSLTENIDFTATAAMEGGGEIVLTSAYCLRHGPEVGGYVVRYDDDYLSFSPSKAFEAGYERIDGGTS